MLTQADYTNLLMLVRTATPDGFAEGKALVILEGKLIQTLRDYETEARDAAVEKEIKQREEAESGE